MVAPVDLIKREVVHKGKRRSISSKYTSEEIELFGGGIRRQYEDGENSAEDDNKTFFYHGSSCGASKK